MAFGFMQGLLASGNIVERAMSKARGLRDASVNNNRTGFRAGSPQREEAPDRRARTREAVVRSMHQVRNR